MAKNGERLKLNSAYVPHDPVVAEVGEASMTRQEFMEECDINVTMARVEKHGVWPFRPDKEPVYLDLTTVPDNLMEVLNTLNDATDAFMTLPASVRKEFDNDAVKFVEFAQNGENIGKLREYGLAPAEPVADAPMKVEVVNAPEGAPPKGAQSP